MADFPRYLYHPLHAPAGMLFETPEKTARLGPGWVDTPANFPKPKTPGAPTVGPQKGIGLLQGQIEKARLFLASTEMVDVGTYQAWTNTVEEVLCMVFGSTTRNIKGFREAHSLVGIIRGASGWDKHIRHKAKNQIAILRSCVEQLEVELSANGPSSEVDQKFGILLSPSSLPIDFSTATKGGHPVCLVFVDIDNFKRFNTTFTESVVDRDLLPKMNRDLKDVVGNRGSAYKQGGDEFIVLLPNHTAEEGALFAERVRRSFEESTYSVNSQAVTLTVSIGLASWPQHGNDLEVVQKAANDAEHEAKKTRNCVRQAG